MENILDLPDGFKDDPATFGYRCPKCGCYISASNSADDTMFCVHCGKIFDWDDAKYNEFDDDLSDIPDGCRACGGPYPDCMTSCKMFDD